MFYGFWGRCFNSYRDTPPHEGYSIIRRWRDERFAGTATATKLAAHHEGAGESSFFSFTSNVDAHHLKHFPAAEVRECHGNSETWQCCDSSCPRGAYGARASGAGSGRWPAPRGFRFDINDESELALPGPPAQPVQAAASSIGVQCFHGKNHPTCPTCGKPARPAILMFCDADFKDDDDQEDRWCVPWLLFHRSTTLEG